MAKDILAVPVSGAGVERLFSIAGQICNVRRASLTPETISALMILKYHNASKLSAEEEEALNSNTESEHIQEDRLAM